MKTQLSLLYCVSSLLILTLVSTTTRAQRILDQYVQEAIENSLLIDEQLALEQKSASALQEAGKMHGPEVTFLTSYTLATGGRSIDFPVGTLLNDVYSELNRLTGTQQFGMLEDQTVTFLPHNFHDARFRITQPLLRPEIKYNKLIKEDELVLAHLSTDQVTRDLVRDVKSAYLQWMQAKDVIAIQTQGITLLQENKRITESLLKNGMAVPSALMRIESEIQYVEAQKQKAETDLQNASTYFNFLLNRASDSEILADTFTTIPELPSQMDVTSREELAQLHTGMRIQEHALALEQKYHAPKLGAQLDLGSQEFGLNWGGYVLGGIQLELPIWDNKKSRLRREQWEASLASSTAKLAWTQSAFETQLQTEIAQLQSDITIYESYTALLTSNNRYYQETLRRYKEGLANYIELLDARTQVTNTQLQQNLAKYQAWIRHVSIERISASTPIE